MTTRGRPPLGPGLVLNLEGPELLKQQLAVILETIAGRRTIESACKALDIGRSRFHELRTQMLQSALAGLEHGRPGRPPKAEPPHADEVERLQRENDDLTLELDAAYTRTELALAMPHLFKSDGSVASVDAGAKKGATHGKKKKEKKRRSKRRRRS